MLLFVYNMSLRNSNSDNFSVILFQNESTTATVTMDMKYSHVGVSNDAEIPLVLTNHLLEIS